MEKVLVALSGGVDSAVSAALLKGQGYEVVGAFMKVYSTNGGRRSEVGGRNKECWAPEYRDAVRVAAHLQIPLLFFDFEREYRESVLEYLFAEYAAGRTPNPDVLCNKYVKFVLLAREADKMGIKWIATGHYARTRESTDHKSQNTNPAPEQARYGAGKSQISLLKGVDPNKDQSYFLHQLTQDQLARTIFPVGEMTKQEVRTYARELGLPVADKRSTRGICFVGKVDMPEFLSQRITSTPGPVLTVGGREIGAHQGLAPFTVGQRQGIGIGGGTPFFVVEKRFESNTLVVAEGEDDPALYSSGCTVRDVHWIANNFPSPAGRGSGVRGDNATPPLQGGIRPARYARARSPRSAGGSGRASVAGGGGGLGSQGDGFRAEVKLRYRHPGVQAQILQAQTYAERTPTYAENNSASVRVIFDERQRAVTPGQFAVFYDGEACLGGGVIERAK